MAKSYAKILKFRKCYQLNPDFTDPKTAQIRQNSVEIELVIPLEEKENQAKRAYSKNRRKMLQQMVSVGQDKIELCNKKAKEIQKIIAF